MTKTKLAKAISLAAAGLALSATASASTTMYNTWDAGQDQVLTVHPHKLLTVGRIQMAKQTLAL